MGKNMRKINLIVIIFTLILFLQACHPLFYVAKEFSGQVVDADTNTPIEGVIVVAQWIPFHVGIGEGGHWSVMEIEETVTDKEGKYTVAGWGPKWRPSFRYLDNLDPQLSFLKKGFQYIRLVNSDWTQMNDYYGKEYLNKLDFEQFENLVRMQTYESDRSIRVSVWDGRVIKIKKFNGTNEELDSLLEQVYSDMLRKEDRGLPRTKVPLTLKEWNEARKELKPLFKLSPQK